MENKSSANIQSSEVKLFQVYLRKYENDDKLVILEAVEEPATKFGDNWMSVLVRTKLVGTHGDGRPYIKTFITKKIVQDKRILEILDVAGLFRVEAHAYSKILPLLVSFGPRCVYAGEDAIIMEDLAEIGYVTCERRNFLDLSHTIFGLKKLATFHASTLSLKINNPLQFDTCVPLEQVVYKTKPETKLFIELRMKFILRYLDMIEPQTQELQTIKDHVATLSDKIYDLVDQFFNVPKQKFDTICHGDPWTNNLLFLHDNNGKIIDLKVVDYQMILCTSVSLDILLFIYTSVRSSLIEKSFESLIKIYHNEFINQLRQSRVDEKILEELGTEWLEKELRTFAYYGLFIISIFINIVLAEDEDVQQIETTVFNMDVQIDINLEKTRRKLDRIKCVVFHYYKRFHLGIINDDIEPISIMD